MKKVYTNENIALVGMLKMYLLEQGVDCIVRNEFGSSLMGEVAFFEVWPELWVLNDQEYDQALSLITKTLSEQVTSEKVEWLCSECRETNPASFEVCWQCGCSGA